MRHRVVAVLTVVLTLVGLAVVGAPARAQSVAQDRLVDPNPANFTPHVLDGQVWAVVQVGNKIVLGGSFTQAQNASGGPILTRNRILSFDKNTGVIDPGFAPSFNNTVRTLAASPDGQSVYVGGQFGTLNGATVPKAVRLNMANGARTSGFNPPIIDALVWDMQLSGNRLFIGGSFTRVGTVARTYLAELNAQTGALSNNLNLNIAGAHNGGQTFVHKFDVSPDGSTMVVTGNFATIQGQDRVQIGMIDLTTPQATLADWQTDRWKPMCFSVFQYYLNDIDFSPDGSYFVLSSMGGYGSGPPTLCDTVSRWPSAERGPGRNPTWVAYSGGDSVYAVASTGSAIYAGGHHRWFNNPFRGDAAGPGAVPREGIVALDPVNGVPLDWNPGRTRGQGVFDILSTDEGLWVTSDTDRIGNFEYHGRVAFFPLASGTVVPQPGPPVLPVDVGMLGSLPGQVPSDRFLYRVNAGGPALPSVDNGPDWAADSPYVNTGNSAGWSSVPTVDATVPATVPRGVFSSERWDGGGSPEMQYNFPVPAGKQVEVRLYLANRCGCTASVGQRLFDVQIDGITRLDDYDIVADVGHDVGTMKSYSFVSDGTVDIDFFHVVENPLVNAIEIIDPSVPEPDPSLFNTATRRSFDGDAVGATTPLPTSSVPWANVRGGFFADGRLWNAWSDGTWTARPYDGSSFGAPTTLELYGLGAAAEEAQTMTGLFYESGRIYFTLAGDSTLRYRYLSVDSGIIGAQRFDASGPIAGMSFADVQGMFIADGGLYWVNKNDGSLHRLNWSNGLPSGPDQVVSGPAQDDIDWRSRALFTYSALPANQLPVASFTSTCNGMDCTFDGRASSDADGAIASYAWDFGDGNSGTGVTTTHAYTAEDTYSVTLTVTDNRGATGSATQEVQVSAAPSAVVSFVGAAVDPDGGSASTHLVTVPSGVQAGDTLVMQLSWNSASATASNPAGWTRQAGVSTTSMSTALWTKTATAADAGSTVTVTTSAIVRGAATLAAYRGAQVAASDVALVAETVSRAAHTTPIRTAPAGSWVLSYWADKTASTTSWAAPAGQQVRTTGAGTGAGHQSWLLTDTGASVAGGQVGGLIATADSATSNATMATVVLRPAS